MPDPAVWWLFLAASLVLLITPGPAMLFIVARSVHHGPAAGLISVAGVHLATIVHIVASVVGLTAILMSSALTLSLIRYFGAAYLIWMGIRTFGAKDPSSIAVGVHAAPLQAALRDGFFVNMLNPKAALFFLAFLPQFVQPERGPAHWQLLALGSAFLLLAMLIEGLLAIAAAAGAGLFRRSGSARHFLRWFSGAVLIGLGVAAVIVAGR